MAAHAVRAGGFHAVENDDGRFGLDWFWLAQHPFPRRKPTLLGLTTLIKKTTSTISNILRESRREGS